MSGCPALADRSHVPLVEPCGELGWASVGECRRRFVWTGERQFVGGKSTGTFHCGGKCCRFLVDIPGEDAKRQRIVQNERQLTAAKEKLTRETTVVSQMEEETSPQPPDIMSKLGRKLGHALRHKVSAGTANGSVIPKRCHEYDTHPVLGKVL